MSSSPFCRSAGPLMRLFKACLCPGAATRYPCCNSAYHTVFFDLFDRNEDCCGMLCTSGRLSTRLEPSEDGFLSESDFLGGMLAVSRHPCVSDMPMTCSYVL